MTDKKIIGIVGPPFSGESEAADPIFEQAGIPTITPSATRVSLSANGWKIFHRAVANDDAQGPAAGELHQERAEGGEGLRGRRPVGVRRGPGRRREAKTLGSAVVGTDKTEADGKQTDFSATVQKVVGSGATVLFYGGYYQNAGLIRKQLTAAGWKGTLVGGDGMNDPGLAKAAGNANAAGTIVTCPCSPADKSGGTFVADYKTKWNVDAGTYSDVAFDAANIFLQGIDAGNTTAAKMNTYLSTIDYKGIANEYKFTVESASSTRP